VLIFGILVVSFSVYHSAVVPNQFKSTEIDHNEKVQSDLIQLSETLQQTAATGLDSSQTIRSGGRYSVWTAYPSPPLSGTIRTVRDEVTITNVTVTNNDESTEYWSKQNEFVTHSIRYEPTYREYQDPPDTIIEHGSVYNEFRDAQVSVTSQRIVSENSVNLLLIGGDVDRTSGGAEGIAVRPVSSSDSTIQIQGEFSFTLPTDRPKKYWDDALDEPIIRGYTYDSVNGEVNVTVDSATPISFRVVKASFGGASNSPEYITLKDSEVLTKDKYGNPIGGVEVTVDKTGETYFSDSDGVVNIPDPDNTIQPYITAENVNGAAERQKVTVEPGDLGGEPSSTPSGDEVSTVSGTTPDGESSALEFDMQVDSGATVTVTNITIATPGTQNSNVQDATQLRRTGNDDDEVRLTVSDTSGVNQSGSLKKNVKLDTTKYQLDTNAVFSDGTVLSADMGEIDGNVKWKYDLIDSKNNADVIVTFYFDDNTQFQAYLRVTNVNS
jgi:hypothetical protein